MTVLAGLKWNAFRAHRASHKRYGTVEKDLSQTMRPCFYFLESNW
jgi:hypothetical protein